jgi:hypothetical protein
VDAYIDLKYDTKYMLGKDEKFKERSGFMLILQAILKAQKISF